MDTNILSELMHVEADAAVVSWLDANWHPVYITAITAAESPFGVERMTAGMRRTRIASAIADMLATDFAERAFTS
ncbi:hypothetical protein [Cryobacterium aureum]|uniref:hypothetical protein n=1 Tax=Cryobacterium aureum TaxID=995037 RepID=UPI000CF45DCB|nr:hypothetical protein [Cryobacterium aureum]